MHEALLVITSNPNPNPNPNPSPSPSPNPNPNPNPYLEELLGGTLAAERAVLLRGRCVRSALPQKRQPQIGRSRGKALSTREGDFVHPYDRIGENHIVE